jgi:hypothetical protein
VAGRSERFSQHNTLKGALNIDCQLSMKEHHSFWILSIHIQDQGTQHFGSVSAVMRLTGMLHVGGKTQVIFNHNAHGATHVKTRNLQKRKASRTTP